MPLACVAGLFLQQSPQDPPLQGTQLPKPTQLLCQFCVGQRQVHLIIPNSLDPSHVTFRLVGGQILGPGLLQLLQLSLKSLAFRLELLLPELSPPSLPLRSLQGLFQAPPLQLAHTYTRRARPTCMTQGRSPSQSQIVQVQVRTG